MIGLPLVPYKQIDDPLTTEDWNRMARIVNQYANFFGAHPVYVRQMNNTTIVGVEQVASESSVLSRFRVKSREANYITCRTWDGTTEGDTNINIAKPPHVRGTAQSGGYYNDREIYATTVTGGTGVTVGSTELTFMEISGQPVRFLATITGNSGGTNAQWTYTFSEASMGADGTFIAVTGGRTGSAINLRERFNTSNYQWGVAVNAASYPDGFAARPVGGGGDSGTHKADGPVMMEVWTTASGTAFYVFSGMGSHDGACS